jgi:hypothetical protein
VHSQVLRILENIRIVEDEKVSMGSSCVNWKPPHSNLIKLNVDAAMVFSTTSISAVARGHRGKVLKAWTNKTSAFDPTIAEASSIRWALELAMSMNGHGYRQLEIRNALLTDYCC